MKSHFGPSVFHVSNSFEERSMTHEMPISGPVLCSLADV